MKLIKTNKSNKKQKKYYYQNKKTKNKHSKK